jgi:hypothetical protein
MAGKVKSKAGRFEPIEGGCTCGSIRYRLLIEPMFVHCCHCRWCQRETGSAFALNALVEHDQIILLAGTPEAVQTPTNSGAGQNILRCPDCRVALWSHYGSAKERVKFLRVGTLDLPDVCPPDIHIFTESKQPWVVLPDNVPSVPQYYQRSRYWPAAHVERYHRIVGTAST